MTPSAHEGPMLSPRPRERALLGRLRAPSDVQRWLDPLDLNKANIGRTLRSFRGVVARGAAHCIEAALAAAFILQARGRPTTLLDLRSDDGLDHVVLAWRGPRGWGAIGKSDIVGLAGRRAAFRSLRDLAWSYVDPYVDETGRVRGYAALPVERLALAPDWGLSLRELWPIEDSLRRVRTTPLRASDARHARLLRRYRAWKEAHEGAEPTAAFYREGPRFLGEGEA